MLSPTVRPLLKKINHEITKKTKEGVKIKKDQVAPGCYNILRIIGL